MRDFRLALGEQLTTGRGTPVLQALDSVRPILRLGRELPATGAAAAATVVAILARQYPALEIDGDAQLASNPWHARTVIEVLERCRQVRPLPTRDPDRDFVIAIGCDVDDADLWIGGGDWNVVLGHSPQVVVGGGTGFGLQAGAALACAEVLKCGLLSLGFSCVPVSGTFVWNLLDFTLTAVVEPEVVYAPVAAGLFGCGSVGSSTACVLLLARDLHGRLHLVDPDLIDAHRNPYRYPGLLPDVIGTKVDWLAALLNGPRWLSQPFVGSTADWVRAQPQPGFDGVVVSSVDTVAGRLEVADLLAEQTLSLGVSGLALHVQREKLGDGQPCPFCEFVTMAPPLTQIESAAQLTGIPVERVAQLELDGAVLVEADIDMVRSAGRINATDPSEFVGHRLADLVRGVYAEASVSIGTDTVAVSAPFVSWMAGVFAAVEVAKTSASLAALDRRLDLDMSGLPLGTIRRREGDRTGRCVCGAGVRRRWMRRLYGSWN